MYPLSSEIHLKNQNVGKFRTNEKTATEVKHIMAILKLIALERQTAKYRSNAKTTMIAVLPVTICYIYPKYYQPIFWQLQWIVAVAKH